MANPVAAFIAPEAPPQYVPTSGTQPIVGGGVVNTNTQGGPTLSSNTHVVGLASTIILALVVVYAMQKSGFRFVVGAGIGR